MSTASKFTGWTADEIFVSVEDAKGSEEIYEAILAILSRRASQRKNELLLDLLERFKSVQADELLKLGIEVGRLLSMPTREPENQKVSYWPSTFVIEENSRRIAGKKDFSDWNEVSPLYLCGYRVGKINGLTSVERREILRGFLLSPLNPKLEKIAPRRYGAPKTQERLLAIANFLAALCRNMKRRRDAPSYQYAIKDYEDDLAWLKASYYDRLSHRTFDWPKADNSSGY